MDYKTWRQASLFANMAEYGTSHNALLQMACIVYYLPSRLFELACETGPFIATAACNQSKDRLLETELYAYGRHSSGAV